MPKRNAEFYDEYIKKNHPDIYGVKEKRLKKAIRKIVFYELAFAAVAFCAYRYFADSQGMSTSNIVKAIIFGILGLIIPLFFKSTAVLFEKTKVGKITDIKNEMHYVQSASVFDKPNLRNARQFIKITATEDCGKKFTVLCPIALSQVLHEGEQMVKLRGLPYPTKDMDKEKQKFSCVCCGKIAENEAKQCPACSKSILKLCNIDKPINVWAEFD